MAKMKIEGLEVLQAKLAARGKKIDGVVNHMLNAGAKIVKEEQQQAMKDYGLVDTGDMMDSVQSSKIQKDADGNKSITIGPSGYDRKGVSNELKANKAQKGTSKKGARPWRTLADEKGTDKAMNRMREIFDQKMNED